MGIAVAITMVIIVIGYRNTIDFQINCIVSIDCKFVSSVRGDIDLPCKYCEVVVIGATIDGVERITAAIDGRNGLGTAKIGSDCVSSN